jgi:signal transduction histidine kinase
VDLDDVVLRAARRVHEDGRVRIDTSGVEATRVLGDARRLDGLVRNLLDNAVRHARSTVEVALREEAGHTARLTVGDDGEGIPPAERARVFEPFTRLDEARTTAEGGTGLGLAIVRDTVSAHGGSVSIDDRPGGGTRLVVTLPTGGAA